MQTVKTHEKKIMLSQFATYQTLKDMDSIHVIDFLYQSDEWLEKIHFVADASIHDSHLIITANDLKETAISLSLSGMPTQYTVSSILSTFRLFDYLEKSVDLYVQLNFSGSDEDLIYQSVLEDPRTKEQILEDEQNEITRIANEMIFESLTTFELNYLHKEINRALDNKDKQRFYELTNKLKEINITTESSL